MMADDMEIFRQAGRLAAEAMLRGDRAVVDFEKEFVAHHMAALDQRDLADAMRAAATAYREVMG
jgi:phosphopantetheine adenylyltransferase